MHYLIRHGAHGAAGRSAVQLHTAQWMRTKCRDYGGVMIDFISIEFHFSITHFNGLFPLFVLIDECDQSSCKSRRLVFLVAPRISNVKLIDFGPNKQKRHEKRNHLSNACTSGWPHILTFFFFNSEKFVFFSYFSASSWATSIRVSVRVLLNDQIVVRF